MNIRGELFWADKRLTNNFREGDCVWLIYKKVGQVRETETVIPYAQATLEDITKDFSEEEPAKFS